MNITWNGRECEIKLEGVVYDHVYWCDAYIDEGTWQDTGEPCTDKELDEMQNSGEMYEWITDYLY